MNKENKKILIVDDEAAIRRFVRINLETEGYSVIESSSLKAAKENFTQTNPDLVVLDLGLPDGDGSSMLSFVKKTSQTPVIVLSVRASDRDKISMLDAGADDFMAKPFSVDELAARIRVSFRRKGTSNIPSKFIFGKVTVDGETREVFIKDLPVKLTATEFDLLYFLSVNSSRVVTHAQLLKEVWGASDTKNSHYLRVYVAQIRKKLNHELTIHTEAGVGYRLVDSGH